MAAERATDPTLGAEAQGIRDLAADSLNPIEQGTGSRQLGGEIQAARVTRVNEGNPVLETARGERNLVVENLGTYERIEILANRYATLLQMTPREFIEVFIETLQTGRTPRVSRSAATQRTIARYMARVQRLLFTTEVIRSPTQLADTAQTLRVMLNESSFVPLRELMPTASQRQTGTPEAPPRAGGARGAPRAVERAQGAEPRDNAIDRAADEAFRRHAELGRRAPVGEGMSGDQLRDAYVRLIRALMGR